MLIEKTFQGAIRITSNGVTRQYMGYSKKEAIKLFKSYLKSINNI